MNTTVDREQAPLGPTRRAIRYVAGALTTWHAENGRQWSERYQSVELTEDRSESRRWAVEAAFVQAALAFAVLFVAKTPLAHLEENFRDWDAALPPVTEWALAAGRYGWCLLPLICLEAYGLFRLRAAGGVKAWYAEILNTVLLVFWVWFACVICFAALIPLGPL